MTELARLVINSTAEAVSIALTDESTPFVFISDTELKDMTGRSNYMAGTELRMGQYQFVVTEVSTQGVTCRRLNFEPPKPAPSQAIAVTVGNGCPMFHLIATGYTEDGTKQIGLSVIKYAPAPISAMHIAVTPDEARQFAEAILKLVRND